MREKWKDVVGYERLYQVSNLGRVRSMDRVVPHKYSGTITLKGRVLSPYPMLSKKRLKSLQVNLCKVGIRTAKRVHRIVLEAFVGPCPAGMEGCHNDRNPANNVVSNLRWDTPSNNQLDRRRHGTHNGRHVKRSDGIEFDSMAVAAEESGCNRKEIWEVCNNRRETAGVYGWEYVKNSI